MKKQIIELFSGSKTISNFFESKGWDAWSVDNNPKLYPKICCDILEISPGLLPEKTDFIWASPDCSKFSRAANSAHWNKTVIKYRQYRYIPNTAAAVLSLQLLQKTVDIINSYPFAPFIIENPIGRIHHLDPLKKLGHYRYSVNYADFGFAYSKETYLFSNMWLPFSTKKVHSCKPGLRTVSNRFQRSIVPEDLIKTIYAYVF